MNDAAHRWIIAGAGAVGGCIGARLIEAGHRVIFVARGAHADAIDAQGLHVVNADGRRTVRPDALWRPGDGHIERGDVVIVCVKSTDSVDLIQQLPGWADAQAVVCAQNGVGNEPLFLATGAPVIGAMVWMPALHVRPGVVECHSVPDGVLVIGPWPTTAAGHAPSIEVGDSLDRAGLAVIQTPTIERWKLAKLLLNVGNSVDALCIQGEHQALARAVRDEAVTVLAAAGLEFLPMKELIRQVSPLLAAADLPQPRPGGSTWQSATRGSPRLETSHLNGYIVDLAAAHNAPAPLNERMVELALAFERGEIGARQVDPRSVLVAPPGPQSSS